MAGFMNNFKGPKSKKRRNPRVSGSRSSKGFEDQGARSSSDPGQRRSGGGSCRSHFLSDSFEGISVPWHCSCEPIREGGRPSLNYGIPEILTPRALSHFDPPLCAASVICLISALHSYAIFQYGKKKLMREGWGFLAAFKGVGARLIS